MRCNCGDSQYTVVTSLTAITDVQECAKSTHSQMKETKGDIYGKKS